MKTIPSNVESREDKDGGKQSLIGEGMAGLLAVFV